MEKAYHVYVFRDKCLRQRLRLLEEEKTQNTIEIITLISIAGEK